MLACSLKVKELHFTSWVHWQVSLAEATNRSLPRMAEEVGTWNECVGYGMFYHVGLGCVVPVFSPQSLITLRIVYANADAQVWLSSVGL